MKRVKLLNKAWANNPPAHWLVAAYLGYESPEKKHKDAVENTRTMLDRIMASGGSVPIV